MAWWNAIGGIFQGGKDLAEVFVENKEQKGERAHAEVLADLDRDQAVMQQFSQEFHERANRSWWDSLVDGLNRLPRPLMTIAIIGFFVLAPMDPPRFLEIAKAYELMPDGYWALLSVIIAFYFGGRMQVKSHDMKVRKGAVQAAQDLVTMRREFRQLSDEEEDPASKIYDAAVTAGKKPPSNKVVAEWLAGKHR